MEVRLKFYLRGVFGEVLMVEIKGKPKLVEKAVKGVREALKDEPYLEEV